MDKREKVVKMLEHTTIRFHDYDQLVIERPNHDVVINVTYGPDGYVIHYKAEDITEEQTIAMALLMMTNIIHESYNNGLLLS